MHEHSLSVFCLSVQWDYCDLSKRQDRSVLLDYKEKSYYSYLLRYWVAPSSVLWVVQEFFEIKIWDFGTKDLGKHTTKHRTSVLKTCKAAFWVLAFYSVVLNKVAEYSDIPERIRLRQVISTLRDGVPPTVPPRRCAFTDDATLGDCDAFWSKIAGYK